MKGTSLQTLGRESRSGISQSLLVATLETVSEAVIVACAQGTVLLFNSSAQALFGYARDEIIGKPVSLLIPALGYDGESGACGCDSSLSRRFLGRVGSYGLKQRLKGINSDGESLALSVCVSEFCESGGERFVIVSSSPGRSKKAAAEELPPDQQGVTVTRSDVDDHLGARARRHLRALHDVYQSVLLEGVTSSLAHEVNQPLAAITTYADASRRMLDPCSPGYSALDQNLRNISTQAMRASVAISDIRNQAPCTRFASELVHIRDLMDELAVVMGAEVSDAGLELVYNIEPNLPAVLATTVHIQHVVLILLRQCIKVRSTEADGRLPVVVSVSRALDNFIEIALANGDSSHDRSDTSSVSGVRRTSDNTTTGLALSVCTTIIDKHRGYLWGDRQSLGGCRYRFTLPVAGASP